MLLKSIRINGLLSFRDTQIDLRPLNVLIGPNASGKSNLIEIMALLQAVPRDLGRVLSQERGHFRLALEGSRVIARQRGVLRR